MSKQVWVSPAMEREIRRLMAEKGMIEQGLAIATTINSVRLSKILQGLIATTEEELEAIAKALGTTTKKLQG